MMKKMMKMGAALSAVALAVSACFSFDDTKNTYEANVLVHYEPDSVFEYEDFIHQFFKDGADSVSVNEYLTIGPVTHFSKLDADKNLIGGFALCTGIARHAGPPAGAFRRLRQRRLRQVACLCRLSRYAVHADAGEAHPVLPLQRGIHL